MIFLNASPSYWFFILSYTSPINVKLLKNRRFIISCLSFSMFSNAYWIYVSLLQLTKWSYKSFIFLSTNFLSNKCFSSTSSDSKSLENLYTNLSTDCYLPDYLFYENCINFVSFSCNSLISALCWFCNESFSCFSSTFVFA